MKLEIEDKEISLILEKVLKEELVKNPEKLNILLSSKLDIYFKSQDFENLVFSRISNIILEKEVKMKTEHFTENDFNNRVTHIFSKIALESKFFNQMITDKIKSLITIG